VEQASLRFEQYLKRRFGRGSTPKHYLSDLNIFIRTVGNKVPEAVTPADVDAFVDRQIRAGLSPSTINRRLSCVRSFFEYLAGENPEPDWLNPVVGRRHRLKTGSHLPRDAPDDDVARLFVALDDARDRAMFGLMVGAGLRVGEVAALRLDSLEAPIEPGQLARLRVRGKGDKERTVWLTTSLWNTLQAWLEVRPAVDDDHLFLNRFGQSISVSGIQYRLKGHCQAAGVTLTCHQLRHTFARRLAENSLPVDSLAKLLGHSHLETTQRYIDGADPAVRADFNAAMAHLEAASGPVPNQPPRPPRPKRPSQPTPRGASQGELQRLRQKLGTLQPWLRTPLDAFLGWHWPTWRAQTAYHSGANLISLFRQLGAWLADHRRVESWETFRRADLEAWLQSRSQAGLSPISVRSYLAQLRMVLRFMEARDYPLDPGLFRVQPPAKGAESALPRYLPEADYRRLETKVLQVTQEGSYNACFDRAWFLTLAHTGVRLSELLALRLDDLDLAAGRATVRDSKPGRDRVVYLTPPLIDALGRYLEQRPDLPGEDRIFLLRRRSPSGRAIQRRLAKFGQQAGLHVTPHRLRHTLATRLINRDMPIHSLRKLLGHQNLGTTQLYARIYDETLYAQFKAAMSRLEAIAVEDWPGAGVAQPQFVEVATGSEG
jgi:site-specific recombinase XerD